MPRTCQEPNCPKSPIYNYPNNTSRIYCRQHAKEGMQVVGQPWCKEPGCKKYALYNYNGETVKLYCKSHAKEGMINIKCKHCKYHGCTVQPYYNYPDKTIGIYCQKHSLAEMINVYTKTCLECSKVPSFNMPEEKYGIYCANHKKNGMINVCAALCKECNCQASFGNSVPTHCAQHKTEQMINLRKKILNPKNNNANVTDTTTVGCQEKYCRAIARAGYDKATHCIAHMKEGMQRFAGRKCQKENCQKIASYNFKDQNPAYCNTHKQSGMINVHNKSCNIKNCTTLATFGYPGNFPEFCAEHHPKGTKLQPMKKCTIKDCNILALFGKQVSVHCEKHKLNGDFYLVERECIICSRVNVLDYQLECKYCNPDSWNNIHIAKREKLTAFFNAQNLEFMHKTINNCSYFFFEGENQYVIVEIDDNSQRSRINDCDQEQMSYAAQNLGVPTIFLRYNPDPYTKNGKRIDTTVKKRHDLLIDWLCKLLVLDIDDLQEKGYLSVLHLYFDEFNAHNVIWETITPFDKD